MVNTFPSGAVAQFLAQRFGRSVRIQPSTIGLNIVPAQIVPNNPDRVHLAIVNNGNLGVTIYPNVPGAQLGVGFPIAASTGFLIVDVLNDSLLPAYEWVGISPSGANNIGVFETLAEVGVPGVVS